MIVFENKGEIDPRLVMLIGVNVKENNSAIGFFGTGLKYAVACLSRWGETISVQSGTALFTFTVEDQEIRGKTFGVLTMRSRYDSAQLGFTTELGKNWEPWMVYRELWCNAHDEPEAKVYTTDREPASREGYTRIIVSGKQIEAAHADRWSFILNPEKTPLHVTDGLEIYEGPGERIFYRGIAVQTPSKPGIYTYNITERLWLTEDRTAGSWSTDPIIARGLSRIEDDRVINTVLTPPSEKLESRLDYDYAVNPSETWLELAKSAVETNPLDVPRGVRERFQPHTHCPTCGRAYEENAE